MTTITAEPITDMASDVIYTPWTDGYAIGFRCTHPNGKVEYKDRMDPRWGSTASAPTT